MCRRFVLTIFICILFSLCTVSTASTDVIVVKVKQGWVSGSKHQWSNGKDVYKFINVPYALPPIGERRFKDPEPIKTWKGIWDATRDTNEPNSPGDVHCIQYPHNPGGRNSVLGQEDCLYLSIYTPWLPKQLDTKLLDVIVYIHGGAFMFGTMAFYNPAPLMSRHNVVFVKINYRLGPFGFLSTGDDVVPGNMGMKDQQEALKWIKENIAQFGGNPHSVTISGSSAGGASVHFHMLSPKSKGLFHRAMSLSGTMLSPWTIAENLQEKSRTIANHVGCPESPSEDMVTCLQNRPATYLVKAVKLMFPFLYNPFSPWAPTVDGFARNPMLPDFPAKLISQGRINDVPWLNTICQDEGLYPGADFLRGEDIMNAINTNWTSLASHILDFNSTLESPIKEEVTARIRYKYFKDDSISVVNHKPFIQMIGDRLFIVDAERSSRFMSSVMKSPVFFYVFNFRGRFSLGNIFSMSERNYGVSHSDDVLYTVAFIPGILTNTTQEEESTMDFMCNLWESFASKGKPHISRWPGVTPHSFNYLEIHSGMSQTVHENVPEIGSRSFWDSLPIKEYNIWPGSFNKAAVNFTREDDRDNKI